VFTFRFRAKLIKIHCHTTSQVTWLVDTFRLDSINRLVTKQVTYVTSRVTKLVTRSLA